MAEPARRYNPDPTAGQDPFNPAPRPSSDPLAPEPLITDTVRGDTAIDNRMRGTSGNGLLIGAVVVILAAIAFYIFGPGATETVAPPPAETPATTTAPAPDATAPAAPADQAAPAPQGSAPAEPAPAPAEPAPAQPAPAPAPAQ